MDISTDEPTFECVSKPDEQDVREHEQEDVREPEQEDGREPDEQDVREHEQEDGPEPEEEDGVELGEENVHEPVPFWSPFYCIDEDFPEESPSNTKRLKELRAHFRAKEPVLTRHQVCERLFQVSKATNNSMLAFLMENELCELGFEYFPPHYAWNGFGFNKLIPLHARFVPDVDPRNYGVAFKEYNVIKALIKDLEGRIQAAEPGPLKSRFICIRSLLLQLS